MKIKSLLLTTGLLLLVVAAYCSEFSKEVKRTVTKTFQVKANDELNITNKYGNITIVPWSKSEISFSIEITGKGENQQTAETMANSVSIDFNQTGNKISAETQFASKNFQCNNCGRTIHYTVNAPADIYLNLTNKYGNISLDKTERSFICNLKYGNLNAEQLTQKNNDIWCKYGNISIKEVPQLKLNLGYSNSNIGKVAELTLESAYSNLKSDEIGTLTLDSKYDKFTINTLGSGHLNSGYSNFNIENLEKEFIMPRLSYSKLKINNVNSSFTTIQINAAYTTVKIGVSPEDNFKVDLETRYGNIKTNGLRLTDVHTDTDDRYTKVLRGTAGSQTNPSAFIKITNKYADIILGK